MNARIAGVLVVLLIALGGGALLVQQQQQGARNSPDAGTLGQPLLKGLQASQVASIVIRQPKDAITIARKDERWAIAERGGFPADIEKVREFVVKAIGLKWPAEPISEKDAPGCCSTRAARRSNSRGGRQALARLTAGKKYFKAERRIRKGQRDGRYVALPATRSA